MRYRVAYVCPLCGGQIVDEKIEEGDQQMAEKWVLEDIRFRHNGMDRLLNFPECVPHKCPDGGVGMARLAGLVVTE